MINTNQRVVMQITKEHLKALRKSYPGRYEEQMEQVAEGLGVSPYTVKDWESRIEISGPAKVAIGYLLKVRNVNLDGTTTKARDGQT